MYSMDTGSSTQTLMLYRLAKCYLLMQKTELRLKCHKYPECKIKKQLKSCKITTKLLSQYRKNNNSSHYLGPNSTPKKAVVLVGQLRYTQVFSCYYNIVKLQVITISVELPGECNNHHNGTDLKYNLELWLLKDEITQVHLYCNSNLHLQPTFSSPYVKKPLCRLGHEYFKF